MIKNYIALAIACLCLSVSTNAQQTVGLFSQQPGSTEGYVLFSPLTSQNTYLIDKCGYLIHTWTSSFPPGASVYLLEDGTLLRTANVGNTNFTPGGTGGRIERLDWNSNIIWSYNISSITECQHHDIKYLPNGNIMAIVWEEKSEADAINSGLNPAIAGTRIWPDKIVEITPVGIDSAVVVWEWHAWDHLIQDFDSTKNNYGNVSQHPELIDINYLTHSHLDWLHSNAVDYNQDLDQIILSAHGFNEFWIIDHSTSTAQAASHSGGISGKGGDLLYRWGNPQTYKRGTAADTKLFGQHNTHWIDKGKKDAGKIIVFNNGYGRPNSNYSSIEIINTPVDSNGHYSIAAGQPFLPLTSDWIYTSPVMTDFFSSAISGAERLKNGNTIICAGMQGRFFEIDSNKMEVWRYVNPVSATGILSQGDSVLNNLVFRCPFYESTYPGFIGHTLTPGSPIELNPLPYTCSMITGENEIQNSSKVNAVFTTVFTDKIICIPEIKLNDITITLFDVQGNTAGEWSFEELPNEPVELKIGSRLNSGVYIIRCKSKDIIFSQRLVHLE
jgi:hypothetical protein